MKRISFANGTGTMPAICKSGKTQEGLGNKKDFADSLACSQRYLAEHQLQERQLENDHLDSGQSHIDYSVPSLFWACLFTRLFR